MQRRNLVRPVALTGILGLVSALGAVGVVTATSAQATAFPPSTSACNYSNSTTAPNTLGVVGVTPGSTVTISCSAGSFAPGTLLALVEGSGLAGIASPASAETNEIDLGSLGLAFSAADGSLSATFTVPAAFSAPDPNAACPPTQAQINVGLTCDLIVANLSAVPQNVAMMVYQGQGTPNAPTLHTSFTVNRGVKTLTASDVPGACPTPVTDTSHCWWGAPNTGSPNPTAFTGVPGLTAQVSKVQAATNTLSVSAAVYCAAAATDPSCAGLPAGTLVPPQLSGTITTKTGLQPVLVDQPDTTPYAGNGTLPDIVPGSSNVEAAQSGPPEHS